jgi:hypothetical protein
VVTSCDKAVKQKVIASMPQIYEIVYKRARNLREKLLSNKETSARKLFFYRFLFIFLPFDFRFARRPLVLPIGHSITYSLISHSVSQEGGGGSHRLRRKAYLCLSVLIHQPTSAMQNQKNGFFVLHCIRLSLSLQQE